ncbi:unnamed protein product [Lathyrus oleraceus]
MDRDETMLPPHFRAYNSPLPTNPRLISVKKIKVCLMCGDKGDSKRLVFCIQCKACAQHSYCIENIHREDDGTIVWRCVDCAPSKPKCKPESARKSERISYATEAKYKRIIMKKKSGTVRKQSLIRSKEGESVGCLAKNDTEKILPVLKNEDVLCNHPESPDAKDPLNISCDKQAMKYEIYAEPEAINIMPQLFHYPEFDKYSRAQPLSDPVWGGLFRLNNATHFHLVAYLSSGASSKVKSAVTELPKLLDVESLSRHVIWPQSFVTYPPDNDCIGLYFFPQYERDEMIFDRVLNYAIEQDSALKAVINNLELFIFSSHLLPPDDRRICKKYYLWGVFKPKPRK